MSITRAGDTVTVWLNDEDVPTRLVWRGIRYRVTDMPTELVDVLMAGVTHPPRIHGWRFQGTSETGEVHMFDVRARGSGSQWTLLNVYD